jgi:hypothetical protein
MTERGNGSHEWLIEFIREPVDLTKFNLALDQKLRVINSDYDAKRSNDLILKSPVITIMKVGTFETWLKAQGKLGGQNKIPRLSSDRKLVDELKELNLTL